VLLDDLLDDRIDKALPQRAVIDAELARQLATLGEADPEAEIDLIQEQRQSSLFRIGLAFIAGTLGAVAAAHALAEVAEAVLGAVLGIAERELVAAHGRLSSGHGEGRGLTIIAYGSLGGAELGFGSDLDLVFLYDATRARGESDGRKPLDAARYYARFAQRVVHLLGVLTHAGRLYEVDVRLRPDGGKGMLVQSLEAYANYQRERAWIWELQALVRARAVAGDVMLARRFIQIRDDLLRVPRDAAAVRAEVVAMRTRWRAERDRSDERLFDLKQGIGGLVDIEFLLQGLVLQHAATCPRLLADANSAYLITTLGAAGLLDAEHAGALARAHAVLLARSVGCTLDGRSRVTACDDELRAQTQAVIAAARSVGFDFAGDTGNTA
jgi:glutamate-ammonia-ligase adenylyltransferase